MLPSLTCFSVSTTFFFVVLQVAKMMGGRTYKQCRERYTNYLKDGLNVGPWSKEEDRLLLTMHAKIGNKWAEIARHLKGLFVKGLRK